MNKLAYILTLFTAIGLSACNADGISGSEEKKINEYIESKGLVVTETTSTGLRYIITEESPNGANLERGQSVTVNYAGRLLSDKEFDAGTFSFILGIGQVVKGFDEGIAKMKVGEKATIIFPSNLGYGSQKQGPIPKNSPLVFDIEVLRAN